MKKKTLKYVTAHEYTGLTTKIDRMLRTGDMSFEHLKCFANLTYDERAKVFSLSKPKIPNFLDKLTIGGKNSQQLIREIESTHDIKREKCMLEDSLFITFQREKEIKVTLLSPRSLGFTTENPNFKEWLGLLRKHPHYDILYAEAGPHAYLNYPFPLPIPELRVHIAMEPIPGDGGSPSVFCVGHDPKGKWFNSRWFHSDRELGLDDLWLVESKK